MKHFRVIYLVVLKPEDEIFTVTQQEPIIKEAVSSFTLIAKPEDTRGKMSGGTECEKK